MIEEVFDALSGSVSSEDVSVVLSNFGGGVRDVIRSCLVCDFYHFGVFSYGMGVHFSSDAKLIDELNSSVDNSGSGVSSAVPASNFLMYLGA